MHWASLTPCVAVADALGFRYESSGFVPGLFLDGAPAKPEVLAAVAKACGREPAVECAAEETAAALRAALDPDQMTTVIAECESGNTPVPNIEMGPITMRERFMAEIKARASKG